jgi:O-antigen/teichoic acid export membrane protein
VSALLVNQADGYAQMGVFNAVSRIRMVPEMVLTMLLAPLLPMLSEKFGSKDFRAYNKTAYSAFMLSLLVTAPFGLIQVAAPALTLLPYGHDYAGNHAVVRWLMFDLALIGLTTPISQVLSSMNRMWFAFAFSVGWSFIYGGLGIALVPRYGAAGLAAASGISHLLTTVPVLWYMSSREREFLCGTPLTGLCLGVCALCGLTCLASVWLPWYGLFCLVLVLLPACALVPRKFVRSFAP